MMWSVSHLLHKSMSGAKVTCDCPDDKMNSSWHFGRFMVLYLFNKRIMKMLQVL